MGLFSREVGFEEVAWEVTVEVELIKVAKEGAGELID